MCTEILRIYYIKSSLFFTIIVTLNENSLISLENLQKYTNICWKWSLLVVSLEFKLTILFKKFQITGSLYWTGSVPTSWITPGVSTWLPLRDDLLCIFSSLKRDVMEFETLSWKTSCIRRSRCLCKCMRFVANLIFEDEKIVQLFHVQAPKYP